MRAPDSPRILASCRHSSRYARGHRRHRGFTLIEVIIALVLVSVVLLGMMSALRTLGQTAGRLAERSAADEQLRGVSALLRSSLGVMEAPPKTAAAAAGRRPILIGRADAIEWVGLFPARFGTGGMHRFALFVEPGAEPELILRFAPLPALGEAPKWDLVAPAVRIGPVTALSIRYQDDKGRWIEEWDQPDRLPARLRLQVVTPTGIWPDLVVIPNSAGSEEGETIVHGPV